MMDKKTYLEELSRYFNSVREDGYEGELEGFADCSGVSCNTCMFKKYATCATEYTLDVIESLEKWSKEHPPKKYKISQLEYDILEEANGTNLRFGFYIHIRNLLLKGYFKGATSDMLINDYLDNCEVIENNG